MALHKPSDYSQLVMNGQDVSASNPVPVSGGQISTQTASIANGQSLTDVIDLGELRLAGILIPASWDASVLTFASSPDDTTYGKVTFEGTEYATSSLSGGEYVVLDLAKFLGIRYLKIRAGTAVSPVNQTGTRSLVLVLVP